MTRSHKQTRSKHKDESSRSPDLEASTSGTESKQASGSAAQVAGTSNTTVGLHSRPTDASLLQIASTTALQDPSPRSAELSLQSPECHFVNISDTDSHPAPAEKDAAIASANSTSAQHPHADVPSTLEQHQHPIGSASRQEQDSDSQLPVSSLAPPRAPLSIAVHANALTTEAAPHQAITIPAGPRERKLYYLWSPTSKQQDAAGPSTSYVEALEGKQQLLKEGSSPVADVTKLQVARMATFLPDTKPNKHPKDGNRSWWDWVLCQRQKVAHAIDDEDPEDDDCHPEMPSGWRWKVMLLMCCLIAMISYVDRASLSVALIPMSMQYNWSNSIKGAIGRCVLY